MDTNQNLTSENLITNHNVTINARNHILLTGITNVESANEQGVVMYVGKVLLTLEGENLKVQKIDVDTGNVVLVGLLKSIKYSDSKTKGGLLKKLRH